METFFVFKDMKVKVEIPKVIEYKDKDIGNRCYERLKGIKEEDKWTKEIDELIKKHNIKYEIADEQEFQEFVKTANDITLRNCC